jgi:hypothetical protein
MLLSLYHKSMKHCFLTGILLSLLLTSVIILLSYFYNTLYIQFIIYHLFFIYFLDKSHQNVKSQVDDPFTTILLTAFISNLIMAYPILKYFF